MTKPSDSFKQFNYALRPSKQVERKVMIEVLLSLSNAGYSFRNYTYIGFGSPYYVDFVMFDKYLFIDSMICVEWGDIKRRMQFNKPFKFIKLKLGALSKYIPNIRQSQQYLIWVDYDRPLDEEMLKDIDGCLTRIAGNSVFVITIDARPRLSRDDFDLDDKSPEELEHFTVQVYREWFASYVDEIITVDSLTPSHVAELFYRVVIERVRRTLSKRKDDLRFCQIFNYVYRDGAPMLTIGGIICEPKEERRLQREGALRHKFIRTDAEALEISVPPLTVREKLWLDKHLDKDLTANKTVFELEDDLLSNYRTFYKEYPTFVEMLI